MAEKIFGIILLLLLTHSCSEERPVEPPEPEKTTTLTLDDVHCTEAWIKLTTANLPLPTALILSQDDSIKDTINLTQTDTLLYIDSLLPNRNYKYQASSIEYPPEGQAVSSNELIVTTMDTTSHNFTFEMFTFGGEIGSSILNDVAIIDENNIWAVGEIYIADTSSPGYTKYNAVHWDGNEWELMRIYYKGHCNAVEYPALMAIWAFSDNDIIITNGGSIGFFDGNNVDVDCGVHPLLTGEINKIWGRSRDGLYIVGDIGNIAHYNGQVWTKIESGTELNINDIWGDYNDKTLQWEILAVASDYGTSFDKEILQISNSIVSKNPPSEQMWPLLTVWFKPNRQYYVAGSGIYQKHLLSDLNWKNDALDITTYATVSIRGNDINDVVGVGAFGDFVHFNGVRWKSDYAFPNLNSGSYGSVVIKGQFVAVTGYNNREAVILIGRR